MSTVLEDAKPFKTVLGFASLLAEDGRPMHKSWGNSIEFNEGADKIGVDVMRWMYAKANPSDNLLFGYKKSDEVRRQFLLIFWNIYNFFVSYALIDKWEPKESSQNTLSTLDEWILSRFTGSAKNILNNGYFKYDVKEVANLAEAFIINDLSLWYIRQIRRRAGPNVENGADKESAYQTLWYILKTLALVLSPIMPFITEDIYKNLSGEESVHLASWPVINMELINEELEKSMKDGIDLAAVVHALRKQAGVAVKTPIRSASYYGPREIPNEIVDIIKAETNVYNFKYEGIKENEEWFVVADTSEENLDRVAGKAREIIRSIQEARKMAGTALDEYVVTSLPDWPKDYEDYIKKETLSKELKVGETVEITRLNS
jgi:isoleucyl-tRNA synthetase